MRLESIPVILGGLVLIVGLALLLDAWLEEELGSRVERRHRPRLQRDRKGEALMGLGVIGMGAALMGSDSWRWSSLVVIAGTVSLVWGVKRNAGYLRGGLRRP